jgi:hypothetical protein
VCVCVQQENEVKARVKSEELAAANAEKERQQRRKNRVTQGLDDVSSVRPLKLTCAIGAERRNPIQRCKTFANRGRRDFGWEIAHEAVSRRPPISLYTIVARTEGYTYAAKVWALTLVQGPFSVAPCQPNDSQLLHRCTSVGLLHRDCRQRHAARGEDAERAHTSRLSAPSQIAVDDAEGSRVLEWQAIEPPVPIKHAPISLPVWVKPGRFAEKSVYV